MACAYIPAKKRKLIKLGAQRTAPQEMKTSDFIRAAKNIYITVSSSTLSSFCASIMCSKHFCRQYMANGISFLLKLPELFQVPSRSLYRRCTVAFNMVAVPPFFVGTSLLQRAELTWPAWNFSTGFCPGIFFTSSQSSNAKGSLSVREKRAGVGYKDCWPKKDKSFSLNESKKVEEAMLI